ncbi:hypothetical protein O9H85_18520 [Paenibacillus filicis]|uniref:Uncharacterized protein n=1 Tax=Paenibacillus gyeongsangnamensis TaxID=3388067 RepID=A0ABT4QC25_9BACL|nr:hypothetical protein [Paenibacillus filicis]MCZ8514379.1 hypothetical protein [Paenibacillus filicis]
MSWPDGHKPSIEVKLIWEGMDRMLMLFAVLGGIIGLAVTGSAVLLAWTLYSRRGSNPAPGAVSGLAAAKEPPYWMEAAPYLLRWTVFDYALIVLFAIGGMLLFTDLIAVLRDAELYPPYHYPYLLCGFVFTAAGMLMQFVRLAVTLALVRRGRPVLTPDHHDHPGHAEHPEQGI